MTILVLIGMVAACAKLWVDLGAMRSRVLALELGEAGPWFAAHDRSFDEPLTTASLTTVTAPPFPEAEEAASVDVAEPCDIENPASVDDKPPTTAIEPAARPPVSGVGFEELFGRRLPIWAGGATLAVAGVLIVRYSIDAGLLAPLVRVMLGLLFGAALIGGAEIALRAEVRVRDPRVRQALAGAGVATLYASILVAGDLYHLIAPLTAFVGLAVVTALAGCLSLRFGAPSAVLGLVGGLAAPALVSAGAPGVPLLAAYLALAIGGLCALSRRQRWTWLGVSALVGGFGWGAMLILGGALDAAASLSIGAYLLLLGVGVPLFAFGGARAATVRLGASLAACAQIAALVALGGFGALDWGLFGLVSIAFVWLSQREAALADLAAVGLATALLLAAAWPHPDSAALTLVLLGIAATYGAPAAWRVWGGMGRLGDAVQVAAVSAAVVALPAQHLALADHFVAALALLGSGVAAATAILGWRCPRRHDDGRFAILSGSAAALLALAAMSIAPAWLLAPDIAAVAIGLLLLAERAADPRVERIAWGFAAAAVIALALAPGADSLRAIGTGSLEPAPVEAIRWLVPALAAAFFASRGNVAVPTIGAQPLAVLLAYVAVAQLVPGAALAAVASAMLGGLALDRRLLAGASMAAAIIVGWAAPPLATWAVAGGGALLGVPVMVTALPTRADTLLRLAVPALAIGFTAWRASDWNVRKVATIGAVVLAAISLHILFKQVFGIADAARFVRLGFGERTVWEMLLTGVAAVALWQNRLAIARAFGAAALAHFVLFTGLLHDPLWTLQAAGAWPLANLLLPAYGTALILLWWGGRTSLAPMVERGRGWLQMALIALFAATTLRQLAHGTLLSVGEVGPSEDIARSALLVALAVGFLRHGIARAARDWRIASLALMLAAVAKVFLRDAAGLDGLLRIASFAGLGFSLIGIGWLYARYLPDDSIAGRAGGEVIDVRT